MMTDLVLSLIPLWVLLAGGIVLVWWLMVR